ncbi:unnamed protein product [Prunus armeniaca]|uniref:Stigma-specific STIG1-like protein 1 n=1 Tax=Prunus armeniaca TaxID=36596 RepID=A0A6J5XBC9_PRUAR|nr:unnamed protein product [Prunus armeniaca]
MKVIKILLIIATTMALSITLTTGTRVSQQEEEGKSPFTDSWKEQPSADDENKLLRPSKRVNRFLAENEVCHEDYEDTCTNLPLGHIFTCCNHKCVELSVNKDNCGACHKKCNYTQSCCGGQCVDLSSDKRHCGLCNHPCNNGASCVYGLCDYA